jgi:hypothetical protein
MARQSTGGLARIAVAIVIAPVILAAATHGVTSEARRDAIARAQVWVPRDVESMDLLQGPQGPGGFQPNELVDCTYTPHERHGGTPKFHCQLASGSVVKIKYGANNGEVYGGVLATRLLWALGFGADRQYPVRVLCHGCGANPWEQNAPSHGDHLFEAATLERPLAHEQIETRPNSGWSWRELDLVDEAQGGATRAQRDALRLLAVFLQHTDSKSPQQRLICLDRRAAVEPASQADGPGAAPCAHPFMYVHDVGLTFGAANTFNHNGTGSTNLDRWRREPIWRDPEQCIGNLRKSATGTLEHPRISEAGRTFLASLLIRLTDAQISDLFTVGRVEQRAPDTTIADWVATFQQKRDEIVNHRCPE